jgi:hypothetical protein
MSSVNGPNEHEAMFRVFRAIREVRVVFIGIGLAMLPVQPNSVQGGQPKTNGQPVLGWPFVSLLKQAD